MSTTITPESSQNSMFGLQLTQDFVRHRSFLKLNIGELIGMSSRLLRISHRSG